MNSTYTYNEKVSIATTILNQLGGRRFTFMTGAKNLELLDGGIKMSIGRNATSANRFEVVYDGGRDLYIMRFVREAFSRKTFTASRKVLKEYDGIYCDQLESLFSNFTGLATRF